jgi:hypothetical protein
MCDGKNESMTPAAAQHTISMFEQTYGCKGTSEFGDVIMELLELHGVNCKHARVLVKYYAEYVLARDIMRRYYYE